MGILNKRLKAASLLECIVAGIIMLVCFILTMEVLTRITLYSREDSVSVAIEIAMKQKYREYLDRKVLPGKYRTEYDWGVLEAGISDYYGSLKHLTLIASPLQGGNPVRYDCLIPTDRPFAGLHSFGPEGKTCRSVVENR